MVIVGLYKIYSILQKNKQYILLGQLCEKWVRLPCAKNLSKEYLKSNETLFQCNMTMYNASKDNCVAV